MRLRGLLRCMLAGSHIWVPSKRRPQHDRCASCHQYRRKPVLRLTYDRHLSHDPAAFHLRPTVIATRLSDYRRED